MNTLALSAERMADLISQLGRGNESLTSEDIERILGTFGIYRPKRSTDEPKSH